MNSSARTSGTAMEKLSAIKWPTLTIDSVKPLALRAPIVAPVRGAFSKMDFRPGLIVRLLDSTGHEGIGEIWANFPLGGTEYKAALLKNYVAPLLSGSTFSHPSEIIGCLEDRLASLTLQTGDFGSMAQISAGIDQAAWDLFSKYLGVPFWQLAGACPDVPVYASGIGPEDVAETIRREAALGHCRFKFKMGFGDDIDMANLEQAIDALPKNGLLMTDANQAWTSENAGKWLRRQDEIGIFWCEEPLRADAPIADWRKLASLAGKVRLAGGENLRGLENFSAACDGGLRILQPDVGKWGGITGALRLDALVRHTGVCICPHWLSGAVGLAASLQLKAAIGGEGFVEFDTNPNALRTSLMDFPFLCRDGKVTLPDSPGLVPPLLNHALDRLKASHHGVVD